MNVSTFRALSAASFSLATIVVGVSAFAAGKTVPTEVVIIGKDKAQSASGKPLFDVPIDPYESIRGSLVMDQSLLLTQSAAMVASKFDSPPTIMSEHLVQPWNDVLLAENENLRLPVRAVFRESRDGRPNAEDEKGMTWSVSIINENGQVFLNLKGDGLPPEALAWAGSNEGPWPVAGHDYSAIYVFTSPGKPPRTVLGQPLRFSGLIHKVPVGFATGLDSSIVFGAQRDATAIEPEGRRLLRAAGDHARLRANGCALGVNISGPRVDQSRAQAEAVRDYLATELAVATDKITMETHATPLAVAQVIVLLQCRAAVP